MEEKRSKERGKKKKKKEGNSNIKPNRIDNEISSSKMESLTPETETISNTKRIPILNTIITYYGTSETAQ